MSKVRRRLWLALFIAACILIEIFVPSTLWDTIFEGL